MKILRILSILVVIGTLGACSKMQAPILLTQANLDTIQDGMSGHEVQAILGKPTDSKTEPIPIVGGTKTTYTYTTTEGVRIVIVLKNDTVQSKEGHFPSHEKKP